jgi:hypothetical protein
MMKAIRIADTSFVENMPELMMRRALLSVDCRTGDSVSLAKPNRNWVLDAARAPVDGDRSGFRVHAADFRPRTATCPPERADRRPKRA